MFVRNEIEMFFGNNVQKNILVSLPIFQCYQLPQHSNDAVTCLKLVSNIKKNPFQIYAVEILKLCF